MLYLSVWSEWAHCKPIHHLSLGWARNFFYFSLTRNGDSFSFLGLIFSTPIYHDVLFSHHPPTLHIQDTRFGEGSRWYTVERDRVSSLTFNGFLLPETLISMTHANPNGRLPFRAIICRPRAWIMENIRK